jgi:membrane-associated phospholipid phosphatase
VVLLPPRWRVAGLKVLFGLTLALSLNRIAAGGHFLSDVVIAWGMTLAVVTIAYRYLYLTPPPALAPERLEGSLTAAGEGIRGLIRRITERRPA